MDALYPTTLKNRRRKSVNTGAGFVGRPLLWLINRSNQACFLMLRRASGEFLKMIGAISVGYRAASRFYIS